VKTAEFEEKGYVTQIFNEANVVTINFLAIIVFDVFCQIHKESFSFAVHYHKTSRIIIYIHFIADS
jgi:hypothetical protein